MAEPSVTGAELLAIGINPVCPLLSARITGEPIRVRYGDALITRASGGQIAEHFGWFTLRGQQSRRHLGQLLHAELMRQPGWRALMGAIGLPHG